jgi:hypothetical protein
MFSKQDKMKVPVGTPRPPTTWDLIFHILSQQLIASSFFCRSPLFGIWKLFARCLFKLWRCVSFLFGANKAYASLNEMPCCQIWISEFQFVWRKRGNEFHDGPLHFKPFPLVLFLHYKKKNLSCLLSSVCLKTSFSSSLPESAFAGFLIVLLIPPAGSFYQLQSREAEGVAKGRTWSSATD